MNMAQTIHNIVMKWHTQLPITCRNTMQMTEKERERERAGATQNILKFIID